MLAQEAWRHDARLAECQDSGCQDSGCQLPMNASLQDAKLRNASSVTQAAINQATIKTMLRARLVWPRARPGKLRIEHDVCLSPLLIVFTKLAPRCPKIGTELLNTANHSCWPSLLMRPQTIPAPCQLRVFFLGSCVATTLETRGAF